MDKQKGQEQGPKDRSAQQRDRRSGHQSGSGSRPPEREREEQEGDDRY